VVTEPVLVVDFGTTTSSAVLVTPAGAQIVREPGSDRDWWPSAVCVDGDEVLVGSPAEQMRRYDPTAHRSEFKPDLGDTDPIPLAGKSFHPQDLVAEVLSAIAAEARHLHDASIDRLVLTVPAAYGLGDPRRDLMIAAGERIGFAEVELLPEPVAAAFAAVRGEPFTPGEVVLVYDFGGGTFDVALVEIAADGCHRVLGHDAEAACGGRDMDAALRRRLRELGGERLAALLGDRETAGHIAVELGELVRRIKHHLSDASTARDFLHATGLRVSIERAELVELCRPVVEQTVGCCRKLLDAHDVTPGVALLVGGTCRMPLVAEAVTAELGLPVRFARDVSTAVVHGAAEWAGHADARTAPPVEPAPDERPLRWNLPGGSATFVRWLVEPGASYEAGAVLATVRLADGTLHRLTAGDTGGALLRTHAGPGTAVTAHDWLATAGRDGSTERAARVFDHGEPVLGAAFCAKGRVLATQSARGIKFWEPRTGALVHAHIVDGLRSALAAAADGALVAAIVESGVVALDARTGREVFAWWTGSWQRVALDGSGAVLAAGHADNTACVWSTENATVLMETLKKNIPLPVAVDHPAPVDLSRDGRRLVTGHAAASGGTGLVVVWDITTGEPLLWEHTSGPPLDVTLSADGRTLAALDSSSNVHVWDAVTAEPRAFFRVSDGECAGERPVLRSTDDGSRLAMTLGGQTAVVCDTADGAIVQVVECPGVVHDLAFAPGGRWLVTACRDGRARLTEIAPA
jgi:actin-like ATPase involved in cell morphogenesis/WD40 repeat protein